MPRGKVWAVYVDDDDMLWSVLVDADAVADTNRGWDTTEVELYPVISRGARLRYVFGISPATGRSGKATCATVACDLWTFTAPTFDIEASDGSTDTMTVTRRRGEHIPRPRTA